MLLEIQCEISDDLRLHVVIWFWSAGFYEVHSQQCIICNKIDEELKYFIL